MVLTSSLPWSLRQLQYVLAIAEEGSFGRAAERCAVSQPSLSAQVAKLESTWEIRLFDRLPTGVRLTRDGEQLLPRIRRLLEDASMLHRRAEQVADPDRIVLRVGVIPTVAPYLLPRALDALRTQVPELTVHWIEAQTAHIEGLLQRGDLDAGIIADPPRFPNTESAELGLDGFVLLVPEGHAIHAPVTLGDLPADEVLLLGEGHCLRDHAMSLCMQQGANPSPFWATSLPTLVQMVGEGLGVTLLPQMAETQEVSRAHVRAVPLAEPAARTLRLVWPSRETRQDLIRRVVCALASAV